MATVDTSEIKLALRLVYADDSKETITINNISPTNGVNPNLKGIIMQFNENRGGALATKMKSKNGFNWIGIDKATATKTQRTYIF